MAPGLSCSEAIAWTVVTAPYGMVSTAMMAATPKPRRGVSAAMTRPMPAKSSGQQRHGDQSLREALGLVAEVELRQQRTDVEDHQRRRGEDEERRGHAPPYFAST